MELAELNARLIAALGRRSDVVLKRGRLEHRSGHYEYLKAASARIGAADRVLLIAAGVHGDERSGPLTLAQHGEAIVQQAHARGVKLIIYPLRNPSGYERGLRYNADHDRGPEGNNDFLRYEREDGRITSSLLHPAATFRRFFWSSDPALAIALPLETKLMHGWLREDPLDRVAAAIDLHQDHLTPGAPPAAYHYAFGDLEPYRVIAERIDRVCPLLRNTRIGAGFGTIIDAEGRVVGDPLDENAVPSDEWAFIVRHDGTLTDLLYRLGVRHSIAAETTGASAIASAIEVNRIWIEGLLDLIAPG